MDFADEFAAALEAVAPIPFSRVAPIIKHVLPEDERYVLGIVLEPETVDAQGDVIASDEIRQAAFGWMVNYRRAGLQHKSDITHSVKVVESYLAPCDLTIAGVVVRRGTWLMGWRIEDDQIWAGVKSGDITGFSIGGHARRVPEAA
jgi:DNA adenine methylase